MIQTIHLFENHSHTICTSKTDQHIHDKSLNCELDVIKKSDGFLFEQIQTIIVIEGLSSFTKTYNFLLAHQQLPFSLRGPPEFV
ncbi:hypothetical protein OAS45_00285 [Polaribacter sp.]|nr:hypothetical protein [Polaribacter sp.]MDC1375094.1 hypothetical protein [Polaribacter sp.]